MHNLQTPVRFRAPQQVGKETGFMPVSFPICKEAREQTALLSSESNERSHISTLRNVEIGELSRQILVNVVN